MAAPTVFASAATNPGGTGSTLTVTLSTHATDDLLIFVVENTGNTAWAGNPAGWTRLDQRSVGTSTTGIVQTWFWKRAASGAETNPALTLGATVTRGAICWTVRGADLGGPFTLPEYGARGFATGTSNPVRPPSVTTLAPDMLVLHGYGSRAATNAPDPTSYTQDQEIIISGTLVLNGASRTIADQNTALTNQDASPTSGVRWAAGIICIPSPDYVYYRSGAQATTAAGTSVTGTLPTGTSSSDWRTNKDLVIATVEAAGTPTISPQVGADWTEITGWASTTSGSGTTVKKYWSLYDGTLNLQFNRSTSGEISVCLTTYRNTHQTVPIGTVNTRQNTSSTTSTWDALTRTETKVTVSATCVADAVPAFTSPAGWTERMDGLGITCSDQIFNAIGSAASASFTLSTASPTLVGLVEIFGVSSVGVTIVTPTTASLTTTLFAPNIRFTTGVIPSTASLTITSFAPSLRLVTRVIPATATLTTSLLAPSIRRVSAVIPPQSSLSITTFAPTLLILRTVIPSSASVALTSFAPQLFINYIAIPSQASLLLTTFAPKSVRTGNYPITGILDNFNRANEGPPPSANWTTGIANSFGGFFLGHSVTSNQLSNDFENPAQNYWNVQQFGPDCEVYITVTADTGIVTLALAARLANIGQFTTDGYAVQVGPSGPGNANRVYTIYRIDNGSLTTLITASESGVGSIVGNKYGIQIVGNVIVLWGDTGSGWEIKLDTTDSTYSAAGFIGIITESGLTARWDDFSGGSITSTLTITPNVQTLNLTTFPPVVRESVTPSTLSLALSTFAPTVLLTANVLVIPTTTSLTTTGFSTSLVTTVSPLNASLSLSTFAVKLSLSVIPQTDALSISSFAPLLVSAVTPDVHSITIQTFAPTLKLVIEPPTGPLSITSFQPTVTVTDQSTLIPGARALTLSTFAPIVLASVSVTPLPATLLTNTFAPQLSLKITPSTLSLSLSTLAPALRTVTNIVPSTDSLTLITLAPSTRLSERVIPSPTTLTIQTFAPTPQFRVVPETTALITTTFAANVLVSSSLTPSPASLALTTFEPSVTGAILTLIPNTLNLAITSHAPNSISFNLRGSINIGRENRTIAISSDSRRQEVSRENRVQ